MTFFTVCDADKRARHANKTHVADSTSMLKKTRLHTNVTSGRSTRVDAHNDTTLELEGQSGCALGDLDAALLRVLGLVLKE